MPPADGAGVSMTAILRDGKERALAATGTAVLRANVADDAARVRFDGPSGTPLFHQVSQTGFDREPPADKVANGLEVTREIRGADGKPATTCPITARLDVVLFVRTYRRRRA